VAECYIREELATEALADPGKLFSWAQRIADKALPEDVYRNKEGRKTLRFEYEGRPYFLKLHLGIGWREIFKNLFKLRLPVLGAANEYRAVNELHRLGVDTMAVAAYSSEGVNPAAIKSLIITDELVGTVSLEDYCANWKQTPPDPITKMRLILKLADSARLMHEAGINHRDFYICHFHFDEPSLEDPDLRCHLIDLHRAQMRENVPRRWLVKDLAGLYFSAMDCELTPRDLLRFIRRYNRNAGGLRAALDSGERQWRAVTKRATGLYLRENGVLPGREPF
jgi:heptose I phosphotransferase